LISWGLEALVLSSLLAGAIAFALAVPIYWLRLSTLLGHTAPELVAEK
jgi:hypothetical protein